MNQIGVANAIKIYKYLYSKPNDWVNTEELRKKLDLKKDSLYVALENRVAQRFVRKKWIGGRKYYKMDIPKLLECTKYKDQVINP